VYRTWKEADRCPVCHAVLDHTTLNPGFVLARDSFDVSYTYDGACIVSDLVDRILSPYPGVDLKPLPHNAGFHLLNVEKVIDFDVERRTTRFEKFCPGCQRFRSVAGGTPAFLRAAALAEGVYRTDVEFGTDDERHPLVIVTPRICDVFTRQAATSGIRFEAAEGARA
jgi:hypothetical protein